LIVLCILKLRWLFKGLQNFLPLFFQSCGGMPTLGFMLLSKQVSGMRPVWWCGI
jgi:hypothetical protein